MKKSIYRNYFTLALLISICALAPPIATAFQIMPSAGPNGTISPKTIQTVSSGASKIFIATPAPGYKVESWLVDGVVMQTTGTHFLLSNVLANHAVKVTFNNNLTVLYAGANNGKIYYSVNGGLNWAATKNIPNMNNFPVKSVFASQDLLYAGLSNGSIYYSWSNGNVWAAMTKPDGGAVNGIFATPTTLYAATAKGNVYTSPVNNIQWTKLTSPHTGFALNSIFVSSPTILYTGSADGKLYLTGNGGQSWKAINGPDGSPVKSTYIGGNKLYVNTQNQYVYNSFNVAGCVMWTLYGHSAFSLFVNANASKIYAGTETGQIFSLIDGVDLGSVASSPINSIFVWE